jgi:hypothetical protein
MELSNIHVMSTDHYVLVIFTQNFILFLLEFRISYLKKQNLARTWNYYRLKSMIMNVAPHMLFKSLRTLNGIPYKPYHQLLNFTDFLCTSSLWNNKFLLKLRLFRLPESIVEFWTRFKIKIPWFGSILNELGSKFNTSGLNIQCREMTPLGQLKKTGSKYFVTPVFWYPLGLNMESIIII